MRVLFIRPRLGYYVTVISTPPLGPLALASFLQSKGHCVRIVDREIERDTMKAVKEFQPDAVAITLLGEASIPDAMQISRDMKTLGLPVLWGGHMASAIPKLAARCGCVDYIGISEGEYTLLELLEVIEGKRKPETVLGIAYVDENGEYHRTADRPFADLADFPPLDYTLIPVERYLSKGYIAKRSFLMIVSRGCPFSCTFCFNSEFHRCQRREYPPEVILQQLKTLAEKYKVDGLSFNDELFGANKKNLRILCQGIQALGLKLRWFTETSIGLLTREDMQKMHDAGCRMLFFGLESGSAEMRKMICKTYDASKLDETFRTCREIGIISWASFIIGLPDETPEQLRETLRLCFRLCPDIVHMNIYSPVPGSQLYRSLVASGKLVPAKSLDELKAGPMQFFTLSQNYSHIPDKELHVILGFFHWREVFVKKTKAAGSKRSSALQSLVTSLLSTLRKVGLRGLIHTLWRSVKLFCTVAWYAHAYPSIRKKYGLYAKNFGRTQWDD